ncbi:MAG: GNAT family N-acetyltransferase [Gammaproteobacteria bacterium]|nr:GNAT family N-acetyltransferase [Gammaproteobacteria bacterium]
MLVIRQMQLTDLPAVVKLQDRCYSQELFESADLVKSRLLLTPQSYWVALYQDKLWAYLFSYPAVLGKINALGQPFAAYSDANCLYVHDLAVSSDARGQGVATKLLEQAIAYARELDFDYLSLVSVQNSLPFWQDRGFSVVTELSESAVAALASYTNQKAHYMVKTII